MSKYIMGKGWYKESERHRLARLGIKTGRKVATLGYGMGKINYAKKEDYFNIRTSSPMQADKLHDKLTKAGINSFIYDWGTNKLVSVNKKDKGKVKKLLKVNFQKHPLPPQHISQAPLPDKDKDGTPDIYDWDDDNDGVPDWKDTEGMFSIDRFKGKGVFDPFHESQVDSDFDGVPDVRDLHPLNPHKARDWAKLSIRDMQKKYGRLHKYIWGTEGSQLPSFKYKTYGLYRGEKLDPKKTKALKRAWLQKRINEIEWRVERKKSQLKKSKILRKAREKIVTMNEPKMKKLLEKALNKKVDKVVIRKNPLTKETEVSYKLKHRKGWSRINFAKPEIVGQQLRIRIQSPKKFEKFRTQDIGRPGYLQRLAGYDEDTNKWQTQSWRLNLSDYKDYGTVAKTIQGLRISPKLKKQARQQARNYFSRRVNLAKVVQIKPKDIIYIEDSKGKYILGTEVKKIKRVRPKSKTELSSVEITVP